MEVRANVTVTCELCGFRNQLERKEFVQGERIAMTCHQCEERIISEFRKPMASPLEPEYSFGERGSVWF